MMKSDMRLVSLNVWKGKVYIPSSGRYGNFGPFTDIEPIFVANPEITDLLPLIRAILSKKPVILPEPKKEDVTERRDLLIKASGAGSWKRLSRDGYSYLIEFSEKGYLIEFSKLDDKGRWEFDPEKRKTFPPYTNLSILIQAVLDDLKTRPK